MGFRVTPAARAIASCNASAFSVVSVSLMLGWEGGRVRDRARCRGKV